MAATASHRPRTKPPEERRDDLMSAAQDLFLAQGIAATTVEQITSAAGVAKGTFYLYFPTKEDVLVPLGDRYAEQHLAAIKQALAKAPDDWKEWLSAWAKACVGFYLDSIRLHDVLFFARPPTRQGLVDNIVIDHLGELLRAGTEAGAWTIDDPHATAVFLFSGLHGVVDDAYMKDQRVNRARLAARIERLCSSTLGIA
jgi:AcrR family transcriptional regulator